MLRANILILVQSVPGLLLGKKRISLVSPVELEVDGNVRRAMVGRRAH